MKGAKQSRRRGERHASFKVKKNGSQYGNKAPIRGFLPALGGNVVLSIQKQMAIGEDVRKGKGWDIPGTASRLGMRAEDERRHQGRLVVFPSSIAGRSS